MKIAAIFQSKFNSSKIANVAKAVKKETCNYQTKFSRAEVAAQYKVSPDAKPVHYFEELNILGLPKWM